MYGLYKHQQRAAQNSNMHNSTRAIHSKSCFVLNVASSLVEMAAFTIRTGSHAFVSCLLPAQTEPTTQNSTSNYSAAAPIPSAPPLCMPASYPTSSMILAFFLLPPALDFFLTGVGVLPDDLPFFFRFVMILNSLAASASSRTPYATHLQATCNERLIG